MEKYTEEDKSAGEKAMMRIIFRKMAVKVIENFRNAQFHWKLLHPYDIYQTYRFEDGKDINDMTNVVAGIKCKGIKEQLKFKKGSLFNMEGIDPEDQELVKDFMYPLLVGDIVKSAKEWNVKPYDVFLIVRLLPGDNSKGIADTMELQTRTRNYISPKQGKIIDY